MSEPAQAADLGRRRPHDTAVVETPRGSTCKLDFDPDLQAFTLAKPLMAGLAYPYDWGFIPSTEAEDGDPLDVLIMHNARTFPGVGLRCRPIGILEVEQKAHGKNRAKRPGASRCPIARSWRWISMMSVISRRGRARNWNCFSRLPTHSKPRRSISSAGAAPDMRSRRSSDCLRNSALTRHFAWSRLLPEPVSLWRKKCPARARLKFDPLRGNRGAALAQ